MNLDNRETATILAALRYWQQDLEQNEEPPISDHFIDVDPLTPDEIDELCEKINFDDSDKVKADLLAALEMTLECLLNWVDIQDDDDAREYDDKAVEMAQAAIKQAKGE